MSRLSKRNLFLLRSGFRKYWLVSGYNTGKARGAGPSKGLSITVGKLASYTIANF